MQKSIIKVLFFVYLGFTCNLLYAKMPDEKSWKAAAASEIITPDEFMWMAGFGFRNKPADGKLSDVRVKILALEDQNGKRVLMISLDLCAIEKPFSEALPLLLSRKFNFSRDEIIINVSHTHSGPETNENWVKDEGQKIKIRQYIKELESKISNLTEKVLKALKPANVYSGISTVRFQLNRRYNKESSLNLQHEFHGPNDFAVPVLKVTDTAGKMIAIGFGYACHNSVLRGYKWSADYAGFAEESLEKEFPGATALFFQGAGGDLVAFPRNTPGAAVQHGKTLAAAVKTLLSVSDKMQKLEPILKTVYSEISLQLRNIMPAPDETYYPKLSPVDKEKIYKDISVKKFYPYPVQVWKIGDQPLIVLGGEVLVEYSIELKRIFGQNIFVYGYSNNVMAYIPTSQASREGGYEGASSPQEGLLWGLNIESSILAEVLRLANFIGIPTYGEITQYSN